MYRERRGGKYSIFGERKKKQLNFVSRSDERGGRSSKHASWSIFGPAQDEYEEHRKCHHHGPQCKVSTAKTRSIYFNI